MSESKFGNKQEEEKKGLVFNEDGSLNMEASAEVLKTTTECDTVETKVVTANLPPKQDSIDINDAIDADIREALVGGNPADHGI